MYETDEVGDVLHPLAVALGEVLAVELPESYGIIIAFITCFELADTLFVFVLSLF